MATQRIAIIAFVPAIHKGYVDFFSSHDGDIYVFGDEIVQSFVHLTRDLRVMGEKATVAALQAMLPERRIGALTLAAMKEWKYDRTVMPDDEVCRDIAQKHLSDRSVEFVPVFLRWNKLITFKELEVDPSRIISVKEIDKSLLAEAQKESSQSSDWWRQIGAVAVSGTRIILRAHNRHLPSDFALATNGDPRSNFDAGQHTDIYTSIHAEADLIAQAAREGVSLRGASVYVTTFPCPNCARLLASAGIEKVFYAKGYSLLDAEKIFRHFGIELVMVQ